MCNAYAIMESKESLEASGTDARKPAFIRKAFPLCKLCICTQFIDYLIHANFHNLVSRAANAAGEVQTEHLFFGH